MMKAKRVFENIEFKRGQDSKKSLNIGEAAIRKNWLDNFKKDQDAMVLFGKIMLNLIKDNTDFVKIWQQQTSGGYIPGKITYVLDRGYPSNKKLLHISISDNGQIQYLDHYNDKNIELGNITDLLFPEEEIKFIEKLKKIDPYYKGGIYHES